MNKYLVLVTGPKDNLGFDFLRNVTALANKGAVLKEDKAPTMRFPHQAWYYLETDELMEDKPGFKFQIIQEYLNKEQLEALDWDEFKSKTKRHFGITGRNRSLMTRQYLKAAFGTDEGEESSEDDKE